MKSICAMRSRNRKANYEFLQSLMAASERFFLDTRSYDKCVTIDDYTFLPAIERPPQLSQAHRETEIIIYICQLYHLYWRGVFTFTCLFSLLQRVPRRAAQKSISVKSGAEKPTPQCVLVFGGWMQ